MILGANKSLGIDISQSRISFVLLRQVGDKIQLLKAGDIEVPEGAMTDGNITDPGRLAGAIKQLLSTNGIRESRVTVSLVAKPVLTRIIDLPSEIPDNLGRFVHSEIRHSAVLAGKEPRYDFCGLDAVSPGAGKRVFVSATDQEKISTFLKVLSLAGVEAGQIELGVIAWLRAIYEKHIANKYHSNILFALLADSTMTICVFRNEILDFIHCIDLSTVKDDKEYLDCCENQIDTVVQFYDIEVDEAAEDKWEIIIGTDEAPNNSEDIQNTLQEKLNCQVHLCTASTVYSDTPVIENDSVEKASVGAVGLAMKQFKTSGPGVKINLIPPEAGDKKAARKFTMIIINIVAAVLLLMILISGFVRIQLNKTKREMTERRQNDPTNDIEKLLIRQRNISDEIAKLSEKKARMEEVFEGVRHNNWSKILDDIRRKTPASVCITKLTGSDDSKLMLEGNTISYPSVRLFADLLCESEFIASAVLNKSSARNDIKGLRAYSIDCVLVDNEGLQAYADREAL